MAQMSTLRAAGDGVNVRRATHEDEEAILAFWRHLDATDPEFTCWVGMGGHSIEGYVRSWLTPPAPR